MAHRDGPDYAEGYHDGHTQAIRGVRERITLDAAACPYSPTQLRTEARGARDRGLGGSAAALEALATILESFAVDPQERA